jgi:hypothetical protein
MQTRHIHEHLLSPTRSLLLALLLLVPCAAAISQEELPPPADSVEYSPGDHELFLMPTAYTMNEGDAYFSDYELFFLNFTYAPTSRTHVGVMTLFPITNDFVETVTLGLKQNYVRTRNFEAALWGSYTIKNSLYSIGSVFSVGRRSLSLHMACSLTGEAKESNNMLLLLVGARADISRKLCGIVEYTNAKELLDQDFNGLISIGLRFRGESTSWELAGIRPLERTGDFLFLPFLKATFLF